MEKHPFFSVVIPVYDAETTIEKCVFSVLKQTYEDYEVILINDGSKDNSQAIIERIAKANFKKRIRIIHQDNCGAGRTRNHGITYATGEFIAFLDSDDYWDDTFLEETKKVIDEKKAELIYIDIVREKKDGAIIRYERMSSYSSLDKETIIRRQLTGNIPWGGVRKIVKHSLLLDHDIFYATTIKVGEESLYSFKALYYASSFSFQSKSLYHYVDNENSLTSNDTVSNSINVYKYIRDSFEKGEIDKKYESTVRALCLTTMAIVTNVLSQQLRVRDACKEAKKIYDQYRQEYSNEIDYDSLEKRVRLCAMWIRLGIAFPVIIAGKIQRLIRGM